MIKILKEPELITTTCNRCGCKFQYDWTDVTYLVGSVGHVYCPVCDLQIQHIIPKSSEDAIDCFVTTASDTLTTSL